MTEQPLSRHFPAIVALLTLLLFLPALGNDFVNWDDERNFVLNPNYRGLGWTEIEWMWTSHLLGRFVPITWMTLGLDYTIWGMNPFRCPSPSAACLPRSIEGDTGPHPDRSALCGADVCLASATRGIRGMGYRAARRRFRNVFSTGDSGLSARESGCSRRANPRQILLGLLWIFHFGAALKRDCGHPASHLAHPGCVSPATVERRFQSVSGKDSVPIAERSRSSSGS